MKPRLKLTVIAGRPVHLPADHAAPARLTYAEKIIQARVKFGRGFAHEGTGNFLRQPELCLSRWSRRADYLNLDPHKNRPAALALHFKDRK